MDCETYDPTALAAHLERLDVALICRSTTDLPDPILNRFVMQGCVPAVCLTQNAQFRRHLVRRPVPAFQVANRDLGTLKEFSSDGRMTLRMDSGKEVSFDTLDHRHFDHGYAVTSHSAQGLTAERVLIHADTSVHPDLLSSRFGYVAVSRASHEATIFTDDVNRLARQLGTEVTKSSALELVQNFTSTRDQSIGMGL